MIFSINGFFVSQLSFIFKVSERSLRVRCESDQRATIRYLKGGGWQIATPLLGEASTTEIAKNKDAQGFEENKSVAREGGEVAGSARNDLGQRTGKRVTTSQNYLEQLQKRIKEDVVE